MRAVIPPPASRALLALLAVVVSTAGCATKGDLRNVQTDLRSLRASNDSLYAELVRQRRITVDTLGRQSQQLTDLQGRFMQQLRDIAQTLDEVAELTRQNSRDITALEDRIAGMGRPGAGGPAVGDPMGGEPPQTGSPRDAIEAAHEQFNAGQWRSAEYGYRDFLDRFPNDSLAPSAMQRLGETKYKQGLFDEAVEWLLRVQQDFPGHPDVPFALYRAATVEEERGNIEAALRHLRVVVNTYGESGIARQAQRKLDELGG